MKSKYKLYLMWIVAGFIFVTSCSFCYAGKDQKVSKKQTIITSIKNAFDARNYIQLKDGVELFRSKYPDSPRNTEFKELLIKMPELALSETRAAPTAIPYKGVEEYKPSKYLPGFPISRGYQGSDSKKITLGMAEWQVQRIKGTPTRIHKSVGPWGTHEQWVYKTPKTGYFYFENGILTSWQD